MEKKFNTNDYMISHFCLQDDEYRAKFSKAYLQNGFVYASETHVVIKVSAQMCAKQYEVYNPAVKNMPNLEKIIDECNPVYVTNLTINDILPVLENIKIAYLRDRRPCKDCKGEGETKCECCGNTCDCEECNGTGERTYAPKQMVREVYFEKDNEPVIAVEIAGQKYNPVYIEMLVLAMLIKGAHTCEYYLIKEDDDLYHRGMFKFDGIEILVIGFIQNS